MNLNQFAQNQPISSICSGHMADVKMLQYDWLTVFWPISQELDFSQIWNLCKNITNSRNFHYKINSEAIKNQIFWLILPILGAKNFFSKNLALSEATSYGFLAPCQNLEKTNDPIPRKCLN